MAFSRRREVVVRALYTTIVDAEFFEQQVIRRERRALSDELDHLCCFRRVRLAEFMWQAPSRARDFRTSPAVRASVSTAPTAYSDAATCRLHHERSSRASSPNRRSMPSIGRQIGAALDRRLAQQFGNRVADLDLFAFLVDSSHPPSGSKRERQRVDALSGLQRESDRRARGASVLTRSTVSLMAGFAKRSISVAL
jgi:hypothetical protein